jgi:hypothetical protein
MSQRDWYLAAVAEVPYSSLGGRCLKRAEATNERWCLNAETHVRSLRLGGKRLDDPILAHVPSVMAVTDNLTTGEVGCHMAGRQSG